MALPSLQRTQIMDIYTFSIVIVTITFLVVVILVMYGHSQELQEEIRESDEQLVILGNSLDHKIYQLEGIRNDLKTSEAIWKARYKAKTNRLNNLKDELKNLEREVLRLQQERLACVTCTPTLKKKA